MMIDVELMAHISMLLVTVGAIAACVRLVLGPSSADRIVALDLITVLLVALSALLALTTGKVAYLDLCIALALVGFLATVAFARYVERRPSALDESEDELALPGNLEQRVADLVKSEGTEP